MKSIDIVCPLYKAEEYIEKLHESFLKQKNVNINKIRYVLTECNDKTEEILKSNNIEYKKIKPKDFSHSLTREKEAFESNADIIVFVTQDVEIEDDMWLYELTKNIGKDNIAGCFSRQLTKFNNIEKYTREYNYPDKSRIVSKDDINTLGLKTFFFSDAASAIDRKVFVELNGYDGKKLQFAEDMYYAYKMIMNDYKIMYCAESVVNHSHDLSLKETYDRYKLNGQFMRDNSYLDEFGTTGSGAKLAKYVFKRLLQEKRIGLLIRYPFDMASRLIGMKVGKKYE